MKYDEWSHSHAPTSFPTCESLVKIGFSRPRCRPVIFFSVHILTCRGFHFGPTLSQYLPECFLLVGFHNEPLFSRTGDVGVEQGVSSTSSDSTAIWWCYQLRHSTVLLTLFCPL